MAISVTDQGRPRESARSRGLISLPFLVLRGISTAALMVAALIQIFVFARVMNPETFSIFILVGTVGYSLWLCDLGATKFLFYRIRAAHLSGVADTMIVRQSTAIVLLYGMLSLGGAFACFFVLAALPAISALDAASFALFFLFTSLSLTWYALRNISIAIDDYVYFESVEAIRRGASIVAMLLMLGGLPVLAFLLLVNLLWAASLSIAMVRLRRKNAIAGDLRGSLADLWPFYRDNRRDLLRTGIASTSDFYIEHLPYLVVPIAFGLGAPTVILDAIFKFVRGANLYYNAISELVVPRQTSAFAEGDAPTLIRATLLGALLGLIPTLAVSGALLYAGELLFRTLLGPAATMPQDAAWIIIALLFGTLIQVLTHSLLIHAGFFRESARAMGFTAVAVTLIPAVVLLASTSIVGFLGWYAAAFFLGALLQTALAIRGPIRAARRQ